MNDEEIERILKEYQAKHNKETKKEPERKPRIFKKVNELWDRVEDWADSTEDDDGPINIWPFKQLYYLAEKLEIFTKGVVARKKFMPLFAELFGQFLAMTFHMIVFAVICIVFWSIYYFVKGSFEVNFLLVVSFAIVGGPWLGLLFNILFCPPFWFAALDKATGNREYKKRVSLTVVRVYKTALNFYKYDSDLGYSYDDCPCNCKLYYFGLEEHHNPKSSKPQYPPNFYERCYLYPVGTETKYIRFVNTCTKSQLIDELYYLEPTMEFEVTYLRFSKFLKEIRPIEGYEYADGVPELLEKINNIYP